MKTFLSHASESELVKIFIDKTPIAYVILDKDFTIIYGNESSARLRKLDIPKNIGKKCYDISNNGIPCEVCTVREAIASGQKAVLSFKDVMPDGSVRFFDDYAIPLQKNDRGEVEYVLEIMVDRSKEMLSREQRNKDYDEILAVLASLIEAKDKYTATHSDHVRRLSLNLARKLKLPEEEVFKISVAATLHDIGKVDIPYSIINKPGSLTEEEFNIIKGHSVASYKMLDGLTSFDKVRDIIKHHHERVDGKGYPDGLTGKQIPIGAKIIAVADAYDAITTTRSYRDASSHEYAISEILNNAGGQFDKHVAKVFASMDFDNLTDVLYDTSGAKKTNQVERVLTQQPQFEATAAKSSHLQNNLDQSNLLDTIFKNTPCGYFLMDKNRKVIYTSDHFLNFAGLKKDDVIGKLCYEMNNVNSTVCENCPVERALKSGQTEYTLKEHIINGKPQIFDLYAVPLTEADGSIEYVIEVVIDRTDEILIERERQQDFDKLFDILSELFKRYNDEQELSFQIPALKNRLHVLLYRKS